MSRLFTGCETDGLTMPGVIPRESAVPNREAAFSKNHMEGKDAPKRNEQAKKSNRLKLVSGAIAACLLIAWAGWMILGGKIFIVETPSMSPSMPVGSLIFVEPTSAPITVGEVISFRPPTEPNTIYSHRVYRVLPGPSYATKGDLNSSPDAWVVPRSSVIGVVRGIIPDLGWLYRTITWMAIGMLATYVVARLSKPSSRLGVWVLGISAVVAVPVVVMRPLVRGDLLTVSNVHKRVRGLLVNTGILPVRFQANGGVPLVANPGHGLFLYTPKGSRQADFMVKMSASLNWWEILATIGICLIPLVVLTSRRARTRPEILDDIPVGPDTPPSVPKSYSSD